MSLDKQPHPYGVLLKRNNFDFKPPRLLRMFIALIGIGVLLLLGAYHQPYYPKTWFDEGLALQGAINLTEYGQYAMRSSEGFRVLDQPLIANGPGLIIPMSAMFYLFGIGLIQARILMVVYFTLAVILFFVVSSSFYNRIAALISVLVLFAIPVEGFTQYALQALGNVPAMAYFLVGILFFRRVANRRSSFEALLAGLLFGLALVTKGQYWIVLPALALTLLADWVYYKQIGYKNGIVIILTTLGCLFLWQYIQYLIVGPNNYNQHILGLSASARVTVFAFHPQKIPGNILYLIKSGFPVFILPGLIVAGWNARQRTQPGLGQFFLVTFVMLWLIWYAFVSVGWTRYAFEVFAIGSVFSGEAAVQLTNFLRRSSPNRPQSYALAFLLKIASSVFLGIALLWSVRGFVEHIQLMVSYDDSSPLDFGRYIQQNIPPIAVIESWEWEIDALTPGFIYHHPPNSWVDVKTAETQFGDVFEDKYDPLAFMPTYLIDGPFSKFTGLYADAISNDCCERVVDIGDYTLYRVKTAGK